MKSLDGKRKKKKTIDRNHDVGRNKQKPWGKIKVLSTRLPLILHTSWTYNIIGTFRSSIMTIIDIVSKHDHFLIFLTVERFRTVKGLFTNTSYCIFKQTFVYALNYYTQIYTRVVIKKQRNF